MESSIVPSSVSSTPIVPAAVRRAAILSAGLCVVPDKPSWLPRLDERAKDSRDAKVATRFWTKTTASKLVPCVLFIYVVYPMSSLLLFRVPEQISWLGLFQSNHQCLATIPRHITACIKVALAHAAALLPGLCAAWLWTRSHLSTADKWKLSLACLVVGMGIFTLFVDHLLLFHDDTDLTGKVAVITGANRGIGLATALALAERGAHVVVTCRSLAKCQPVVDQIVEGGKGSARAALLDLTSLESAANLALELVTEYPQIHYFFANAGTTPQPELTREGFEDAFGGMYLAHVAVVLGILPSLKRGGTSTEDPSRVIIVSSEMSINAAMGIFGNMLVFSSPSPEYDLDDDWRGEVTRGDGTLDASLPAYGRAKLCGILFAFELNRRLKQRGILVIAHAVHTGAVATDSSRDSVVQAFPGWIPGLRWVTRNVFFPLLWRSGQAGSRALLCPALSHAKHIIRGGQYIDALCRPFLHDQDPNPTRDQDTTFIVPKFLSGERELPLTIQIDPVQALLLADLRWSERLWNVSLAFLSASPAKDVVAFAP